MSAAIEGPGTQAAEPARSARPARRTIVMDLEPKTAAVPARPAAPPAPSPWQRKLARLEAERAKVSAERERVRDERDGAVRAADDALYNGRMRTLGLSSAASQANDVVGYNRAWVEEAESLLAAARAKLAESEAALVAARAAVTEAQAAIPPLEAERARVGAPFDRHYAALGEDLRRLDYRIEQHRARGPGASALFIGSKGG